MNELDEVKQHVLERYPINNEGWHQHGLGEVINT